MAFYQLNEIQLNKGYVWYIFNLADETLLKLFDFMLVFFFNSQFLILKCKFSEFKVYF